MADDAFILQESLNVFFGILGDFVEIKFIKGGAEILSLFEDCDPA